VAALRQLSATRGALVQAQQELRRRQARLEGAAAMAGGQASCQAVVMDLQECQEGLGLMQASADAAAAQAGCTAERELLAETRRRIAELNAEKEGLLDRCVGGWVGDGRWLDGEGVHTSCWGWGSA
jgi:hypothetical protein